MEDSLQQAVNEITNKSKSIDDKAHQFIVDLVKAQKKPELIVEKLVANGYDYTQSHEATYTFYNKVVELQSTYAKNNSGTDIAIGLVILIIGIVVTAASSGGVIAYGAIIVGAIKLIRGIANASK
jgi:hypothetical protein